MKKHKLVLWTLAILAFVLLEFATSFRSGSVIGKINPVGSASQVWLVSATDTFRTNINTQTGAFELAAAKAGTYGLLVEGIPPYRSVSRSGISVVDGAVTSVGEIIMER
jgi:hypothetical protein